MSDSGSYMHMFSDNPTQGQQLLSQNYHDFFIRIYALFVVFSGIVSVTYQGPHCLPKEKDQLSLFSEPESSFINSYCRDFKALTHNPQQAFFAVICSVFFIILYLNILFNYKKDSFSAYGKAKKEFEKLNEPLRVCKKIISTPILNPVEDGTLEQKLRSIWKDLVYLNIKHNPVKMFWIRDLILLIILFLGAVLLCYIAFSNTIWGYGCTAPIYMTWNFTSSVDFICTVPWGVRDYFINSICSIIMLLHLTHCVANIYFLAVIVRNFAKEEQKFSFYGDRNRRFLVSLAVMEAKSNHYLPGDFPDFVKFIFSRSLLETMNRSISRCIGLTENGTDAEYAEILACISAEIDMDELPSTAEMIRQKKYRSIVMLLNIFRRTPQDLDDFNDIDWSEVDEIGNNLLFYALNHDPGSDEYGIYATVKFLRMIPKDWRMVCYDGMTEEASTFVVRQYREDPTYRKSEKENLLELLDML